MNSNQPSPVPDPRPAGYAIGDLLVEPHLRRLRRPGGDIELTQRVFDLLLAFIDEPFVLHAREALFQRVWGTLHIEDTNLTQNISILRKALGEERKHWIRTVSGTGYCFAPPGPVAILRTQHDLHEWRARPEAHATSTDDAVGTREATRARAPGIELRPAAASGDTPRPRALSGHMLMLGLIALFCLVLQTAAPGGRAGDTAAAAAGMSIGIVITQTDLARNESDRQATRLLREWVGWKLSRLPAVILIDEADLISGRPMPTYSLDMHMASAPGAPARQALHFAYRPVYGTGTGTGMATPESMPQPLRMVVLRGVGAGLPERVDQASREVLARILPQRCEDRWPALALSHREALRFAEAAEAARNEAPDAVRQMEAVVQAAPEFGPARLLLAIEHAKRRHFRQASEHARLALASMASLPRDAARVVEADASAMIPSRAPRARALYRQLWQANPSRMEFLYRQALIHMHDVEPEAAYALLSQNAWERESGDMRIRRLIARADAALSLGYLDEGEHSINEALRRIEDGQGGGTADLGQAQFIVARLWSLRYAQEDPGAPYLKAAETLERAGHAYEARAARFQAAMVRNEWRSSERQLADLLPLAEANDDHYIAAWSLWLMHVIDQWQGHRDKAAQRLDAAFRVAVQSGNKPMIDAAEMDLLAFAVQDLDLRESERRLARLRENRLWAVYRYQLVRFSAQLLTLQGRHRDALALLDASLGDTGRTNGPDAPPWELDSMSCARMRALVRTGELNQARAQARGCRDKAATALASVQIALLEGNLAEARRYADDAKQWMAGQPRNIQEVQTLAAFASLLIRLGEPDGAARALDQARSGQRRALHKTARIDLEIAQAELAAATGDWNATRAHVARIRRDVPAEARHYLDRLDLLQIALHRAEGRLDDAQQLASTLERTAMQHADAVTQAELRRFLASPSITRLAGHSGSPR